MDRWEDFFSRVDHKYVNRIQHAIERGRLPGDFLEFAKLRDIDFLKVQNVGRKSLVSIRRALASMEGDDVDLVAEHRIDSAIRGVDAVIKTRLIPALSDLARLLSELRGAAADSRRFTP